MASSENGRRREGPVDPRVAHRRLGRRPRRRAARPRRGALELEATDAATDAPEAAEGSASFLRPSPTGHMAASAADVRRRATRPLRSTASATTRPRRRASGAEGG